MKKRKSKTKKINCLCLICWTVVPLATLVLLILDGLCIYTFTTERLLVLGVGILILLIPFFNEISIKNITIKKEKPSAKS